MKIKNEAIAGTLESSDAFVSVGPGNGINLDLDSTVINQYGRQIKETIMATLQRLEVQHINIRVVDKGALECTLKARVECAVFRSAGASTENIPWGA